MSESLINIELSEYTQKHFPADYLDEETGIRIASQLAKYLDIEPPTWKTDHQWQITSKGWVGYVPLGRDILFRFQPKVEIKNIFRMLEYAYQLDFELQDGFYHSETLQEIYENLAKVLALRVLDRKRKGLYREYIAQRENLPYVRGRIEFSALHKKPWQVKIPTQYQLHTSDIADNQLLAWTLFVILRSEVPGEETLSIIRKGYRELQRLLEITPFSPKDCVNRLYNRLNHDYQPMHALCRFFLENSGPTIDRGDYSMIPFVIDMAQLFELFVARWLERHLPESYQLNTQDKVRFGEDEHYHYKIDLVITNTATGDVEYVLDTKYKQADQIKRADINQMVAYGEAKECQHAILIYPEPVQAAPIQRIGEIQIRALTFRIDGDLEQAGREFLRDLFSNHSPHQR
jgi:5-methylcytosine-specific restriction enzyme subunit McrC